MQPILESIGVYIEFMWLNYFFMFQLHCTVGLGIESATAMGHFLHGEVYEDNHPEMGKQFRYSPS